MLLIQAVILGIVQGLTEFLPISSSAHLVIVPWLFQWTDPAIGSLSFDVALHLGTLFAIIVFFWKDWVRLAIAWFASCVQRKIGGDQNRKMAWFLLIATIPGAIVGALFESKIDRAFHTSPISMMWMIVMAAIIALLGGLLWLSDKLSSRTKSFDKIGLKDSILIGLAQALAIFPGVSRSGATITTGLALGLDRITAARFSFLLSAPIIAGAGIKSSFELVKHVTAGLIPASELVIFPIGFIAALLTGIVCIKLLLAFLAKRSYAVFSLYRFALAALVLVVALIRG